MHRRDRALAPEVMRPLRTTIVLPTDYLYDNIYKMAHGFRGQKATQARKERSERRHAARQRAVSHNAAKVRRFLEGHTERHAAQME